MSRDSVAVPSDAQFRLQMGELTASELRTAKAAYRMAIAALTREAAPQDELADSYPPTCEHCGVSYSGNTKQAEQIGWVVGMDGWECAGCREAAPQAIPSPFDICPKCRDEFAECECAAEAAPQASGGDAWAFSVRELLRELTLSLSVNGSRMTIDHDALRSIDTRARELIRRLATPDSAIQSQQGATGGAVDDAAVDRFWDAYIDKGKGGGVIGYSDVRRLLTATIAHPQAADQGERGDA